MPALIYLGAAFDRRRNPSR